MHRRFRLITLLYSFPSASNALPLSVDVYNLGVKSLLDPSKAIDAFFFVSCLFTKLRIIAIVRSQQRILKVYYVAINSPLYF